MTGYLLDTNIISETAPGHPGHDGPVVRWLEAQTQQLYLSVVTVAEIESGITFAASKGSQRKAAALAEWLDAITALYGSRILPLGIPVARAAGKLSGHARAAGIAPGFADIAIAATASHHGLTLLTRNLRHFQPLGITLIDPFTEAQTFRP